jgi:hypothetical protein
MAFNPAALTLVALSIPWGALWMWQIAPQPSNSPVITLPADYSSVVPIRNADGTYMIHSTMKTVRALKVYRNGLRMKPGVDYEYAPQTGIITPKAWPLPAGTNSAAIKWDMNDVILLDFNR